jgi:hydroxymethylbilane synthase
LQEQQFQAPHVCLRVREQGRRGTDDHQRFRRVVLRELRGFKLCGVRALMTASLKIGTRGSKLALWQANWVRTRLEKAHPDIAVELVIIKTKGDKIQDVPLAKVGGKGLFVKEIEEALLDGRIDLAVHSMKDMPGDIPPGLCVGPVPERGLPLDVLISRNGHKLADLEEGASIGTSSLRRAAQLLHLRPGLQIIPLRGNLDTRLRKLDEGQMDAIILAAAGVHRLGLENRVTEYLDPAHMLPAVAQGALCIEIRASDPETDSIVGVLNHPETRTVVLGERAFLRRLEGSCQIPVAGYGTLENGRFTLTGLVATLDGTVVLRERAAGQADQAREIGIELAEKLLARGADRILQELTAGEL